MEQLKGQRLDKHSLVVQGLMIALSIFLLNACSLQQNQNSLHSSKQSAKTQERTPAAESALWKIPIRIPEGRFLRVAGWLSNQQILYITTQGKTYNLVRYDLLSGKSKLLFKSQDPIGVVQISPSMKYILIQSSPANLEGNITITDLKGNRLWVRTLPSYQLAFAWNPYNDSEVLISKFNQDWTFQVFLLNFRRKVTTELSLQQPFLQWVSEKQLAFLNWDQPNASLVAPLMVHSVTDGKERTLFPKVFQFSTFRNLLMTIKVNEQNKKKLKLNYSFFDRKMQSVFSFSLPGLTKDSGLVVPFYDYNETKGVFITLRPLTSGAADTYTEGFQLATYNIHNGKSSSILAGLGNEPLTCAPSGEVCLYGNQFEKLIDLKEKRVVGLVKE